MVVTRRHDQRAGETGTRYLCPMHPEVQSGAPSDCPICGMALEKRSAAPARFSDGLPAAELFRDQPATAPRYSSDIVRRHVLRQELLAPAWIEEAGAVAALLYRDELPFLAAGEEASFLASAAAVAVRATADPPVPWDRSMSVVRFRAQEPLRAGVAGWVKLARKPREILVVPSGAVLPSADGPYVLVLSADGRTFGKRPVEIGKVFSGFTAVVAGVAPGEHVASINAFFVDAERRLRAERSR